MNKAKRTVLRSARARLTAWYVLLLGVTLLIFGVFVYIQVRNALLAQEDATLQVAANKLLPHIDTSSTLPVFLKTGSDTQGFKDATTYLNQQLFSAHLLTPDGTIVDSIGALDKSVAFGLPATTRYTILATSPSSHLRVYSQRLTTSDGHTVGWLQVAEELDSLNVATHTLFIQMLLGIPLILLLAALGGLFLATRALRPIDRITHTAQAISAHDLTRRIVYQGPPDEIGRLAMTFDHMLDRLEETIERERRFTADASHELRTPLTALKGRIEVILSRVRSPEEYAQVLTDLGQDVERLIHLSSALLILARLDQNQQEWQMEMLDVSELLETMVDSMQPLASTREITFTSTVPTGLFVSGDFDELTRLFLNLLDNALKYTPARGRVTVLGKQTGEDIVLAIRDSGPGIAPEHLPHLFERFYRVEEGRTRSSGGAGLGLAIAHEIARKHGGSLEVESKLKQGTTVTVHLPFHSAK
jgi:heavy metal sensor kinase